MKYKHSKHPVECVEVYVYTSAGSDTGQMSFAYNRFNLYSVTSVTLHVDTYCFQARDGIG